MAGQVDISADAIEGRISRFTRWTKVVNDNRLSIVISVVGAKCYGDPNNSWGWVVGEISFHRARRDLPRPFDAVHRIDRLRTLQFTIHPLVSSGLASPLVEESHGRWEIEFSAGNLLAARALHRVSDRAARGVVSHLSEVAQTAFPFASAQPQERPLAPPYGTPIFGPPRLQAVENTPDLGL